MNILCIVDQYNQKQLIILDHTSKFKSSVVDSKPTTYGLKHQKWSITSEFIRQRTNLRMQEIEKKESKKLKSFQKLLEQINQSQYNQSRAGRAKAVEEMFTRKLTKNLAYLQILVPYLNNPSEEVILESQEIREKHEPMKFQNEEVILQNLD